MLKPLGSSIDDVYITHLMKYRPYRINSQGRIVSRAPQKEELDLFIPYLEREIALINPKIIIVLGEVPLQYMTKDFTMKLNTLEDQLLVVGVLGKSYKVYPMYHPLSKSYVKSLDRFLQHDSSRIRNLLGDAVDAPKLTADVKNNQDINHVKDSKGSKDSKDSLDNKDIKDSKDSKDKEESLVSEGKKRVYQKIKAEKPELNQAGSKNRSRFITVVYGGEGFSDDPVLVGIERIVKVLNELEIGVRRIDLYKGNIDKAKLFGYINESKGIILALNVEWYGIGQRMQQFLDECYFHGEASFYEQKPMLGVCFSRHGFERDAYQHLLKSWEILGGCEGTSILATIPSAAQLETNFDWLFGIDKKTEAFFRIIQQDRGWLPLSKITGSVMIETPVSSIEQGAYDRGSDKIASKYGQEFVSSSSKQESKQANIKTPSGLIENYDTFVEKQQQDIKDISSLIKKKLSTKAASEDQSLPKLLKEAYKYKGELKSTIQLVFEDQSKENTVIELNNQHIRVYYGQRQDVDVTIIGSKEILYKVFSGKLSMQRAFMTGEIKAKGEFTLLYKFEEYFVFVK